MASQNYLTLLTDSQCPNPDNNVLINIWSAYEQVVLYSLITSFGLDFLVKDQHGGDVDTIRGVRDSTIPIEERYKNAAHRDAYEARGTYDTKAYHTDSRFIEMKRTAKREFNETGKKIADAYVPGNEVVPNKAGILGTRGVANLDHVISAHEIHEDPGRLLAGLNGIDLANSPENLRYTNEHLNKSKRDLSIAEFLQREDDKLDDPTRERMTQVDEEVRSSYEQKLADAYYSSSDFWSDAIAAAGARGIEMGARQVVGFVLVELWFDCRDTILDVPDGSGIDVYYVAILEAFKQSIHNIVEKHSDILESFGMGFVAGSFASFTTTLFNIFFEMDGKSIRNLRQVYATVVQAINILLFNPNNLLLGDRIEAATLTLGTGASVLVGFMAGDGIAKTPLGADPVVGAPICLFCSTMVSGLLSCTMLLTIDRSQLVKRIRKELNQYLTVDQTYTRMAHLLEMNLAQLAGIDLKQLQADAECLENVADNIRMASDEEELQEILIAAYEDLSLELPWTGNFDAFMGDPTNKLVFG